MFVNYILKGTPDYMAQSIGPITPRQAILEGICKIPLAINILSQLHAKTDPGSDIFQLLQRAVDLVGSVSTDQYDDYWASVQHSFMKKFRGPSNRTLIALVSYLAIIADRDGREQGPVLQGLIGAASVLEKSADTSEIPALEEILSAEKKPAPSILSVYESRAANATALDDADELDFSSSQSTATEKPIYALNEITIFSAGPSPTASSKYPAGRLLDMKAITDVALPLIQALAKIKIHTFDDLENACYLAQKATTTNRINRQNIKDQLVSFCNGAIIGTQSHYKGKIREIAITVAGLVHLPLAKAYPGLSSNRSSAKKVLRQKLQPTKKIEILAAPVTT